MILRSALAILVPLVAASCAGPALPVATGPVRALNLGHWAPGANELTTPPAAGERAGT